MPGIPRDPVSELFDASARRLLLRAYAARGSWVEVWLPDPTIRQRSAFLARGISDLLGPDNGGSAVGGSAGGFDAKTRWARGFTRALNYQHKWFSPTSQDRGFRTEKRTAPRTTGGLRVQVGRHVPASPQWDSRYPERGGFPPRRRVRVQVAAGGRAKDAAVTRLADRDRWATGPKGARQAGPRWSDPSRRDWA